MNRPGAGCGTRHAFRAFLLGASLLAVQAACADQPSSSDLVNFGGGSATLTVRDVPERNAEPRHLVLGTLLWNLRDGASAPRPLTVTSRGIQQTLFFDPAPLLDVDASDAASLRARLQLPPSDKQLPAIDPASTSPAVAALRRIVRDAMAADGAADVDALVPIARCQRRVAPDSLGSEHGLLSLLACIPGMGRHETVDADLVRKLRCRGMLRPLLESQAASLSPHVAGYLVEVAAEDTTGGTVDIIAAVGGAHAEKILSLPMQRAAGVLQGDAARLFIPPAFTLVGIVAGAGIGFFVFLRQQRTLFEVFIRQQDELHARQEADRFQQRKLDRRAALKAFFDDYEKWVGDATVEPGDIWRAIRDGDVYAVLPGALLAKFEALHAQSGQMAAAVERKAIDRQLRASFAELMKPARNG